MESANSPFTLGFLLSERVLTISLGDKVVELAGRELNLRRRLYELVLSDIAEARALLPAIPEAVHLRALLEEAYRASMTTEEGRPVTFTLVWHAPDTRPAGFNLRQPGLFDADAIRRMAPALHEDSALAIASSPEGVVIRGIASGSRGTTVSARKAGHLVVSYNGAPVFVIHGATAQASSTLGEEPAAVLARLLEPRSVADNVAAARVLIEVARSVLRSRHGGTLVVLPSDESVGDALAHRYRLDPSYDALSGLRKIIIGTISRDRGLSRDFDRKEAATTDTPLSRALSLSAGEVAALQGNLGSELPNLERADRVARLAAVDGAVILTRDLEVVGFGAKLQAPQGPQRWSGTRHQSAENFVRCVKGAVALVASQDGSLTTLGPSDSLNETDTHRDLQLLFS